MKIMMSFKPGLLGITHVVHFRSHVFYLTMVSVVK